MEPVNDNTFMRVTRSLAMSEEKQGGVICIRGNNIGRMIPLPCDKVVILGRDGTKYSWAITDAQVSRKHCEIVYIAAMNKYKVTDYSKNGTYLGNGQRLVKGKEYYLSPRDELYLGNKDNLYKLR